MSTAVVAVSARLQLSEFQEQDISDEYVGWLNDPMVVRYSNQRFRRHDSHSCLAYLQSFRGSANKFYALRLLRDMTLVGTMTAYIAPPHGTADMGIMLGNRTLWGQGYGGEAWRLLMSRLFELGLRKVTAGTLQCNVGMRAIMERSGMHLEATRRQQELVDGVPQDILYFAKFRAE